MRVKSTGSCMRSSNEDVRVLFTMNIWAKYLFVMNLRASVCLTWYLNMPYCSLDLASPYSQGLKKITIVIWENYRDTRLQISSLILQASASCVCIDLLFQYSSHPLLHFFIWDVRVNRLGTPALAAFSLEPEPLPNASKPLCHAVQPLEFPFTLLLCLGNWWGP